MKSAFSGIYEQATLVFKLMIFCKRNVLIEHFVSLFSNIEMYSNTVIEYSSYPAGIKLV